MAGYQITLIEGTRNGETFACNGTSCDIPLLEGENAFTFWALSSWGDSSRMGSLTVRVDTRPPQINGTMSGTTGENGWYVSAVTFNASASDLAPGSGIETLNYSLDGGAWTDYTVPVTVSDGLHTITLRAQDLAGHISETSASAQVDTLPPQVNASLAGDQLNGWYLSQVTFSSSASDSGSEVSRIEYALDNANWQPYTAPVTIGDGTHTLHVRVFDVAGNLTEAAPLTFQVDGTPPRIQLPESWYIWENGEVKVSDGQSGLSSVEIEIRDPQGRWQKVRRVYDTNGQPFSTNIAWNRRFADGTLAPIGTYQVVVKAFDRAGNMRSETANIFIPAPNAPTYTPAPTRTPLPTFTATPETSQATADAPTITPTRTPIVSAFGGTIVRSVNPPISQSQNQQSSNLLWGAAALAAIGAATAYALEQRRKRKEEEARQLAEAQAEAARRNAAEAARKVQNWLQGKAMLEAQLREAEKAGASQEQIAALRQTGSTKGLGTALAATTVAIRLLIEKNRAQSQNPQPSASGGGGKAHASLVHQPYPEPLTPADDEPPTFWDKLKQLWNTFWNWVTGKPATPTPTAIPVSSPTSTNTPIPTSTTAPTLTLTPLPTSTPFPSATPQIFPHSPLGKELQQLSNHAGFTSIELCAVILRAEAGQAPREDKRWFSGTSDDPAFIYQEAATRWFWTWGKYQGFDMENYLERQSALYDWLGNGMESAMRRIGNKTFAQDDKVDEKFVAICNGVFEPQVSEWRLGDGMWSWANEYLYDPYPKAQEYLRSHYRYRFGQGATTWYIIDSATLRMLDSFKESPR